MQTKTSVINITTCPAAGYSKCFAALAIHSLVGRSGLSTFGIYQQPQRFDVTFGILCYYNYNIKCILFNASDVCESTTYTWWLPQNRDKKWQNIFIAFIVPVKIVWEPQEIQSVDERTVSDVNRILLLVVLHNYCNQHVNTYTSIIRTYQS